MNQSPEPSEAEQDGFNPDEEKDSMVDAIGIGAIIMSVIILLIIEMIASFIFQNKWIICIGAPITLVVGFILSKVLNNRWRNREIT